MSNGAGKFSLFSQIYQVELQRSLKKSEHSHERYRGKTQRLPRSLREYRGEVPGCPGGVGAYGGYFPLELSPKLQTLKFCIDHQNMLST